VPRGEVRHKKKIAGEILRGKGQMSGRKLMLGGKKKVPKQGKWKKKVKGGGGKRGVAGPAGREKNGQKKNARGG